MKIAQSQQVSDREVEKVTARDKHRAILDYAELDHTAHSHYLPIAFLIFFVSPVDNNYTCIYACTFLFKIL